MNRDHMKPSSPHTRALPPLVLLPLPQIIFIILLSHSEAITTTYLIKICFQDFLVKSKNYSLLLKRGPGKQFNLDFRHLYSVEYDYHLTQTSSSSCGSTAHHWMDLRQPPPQFVQILRRRLQIPNTRSSLAFSPAGPRSPPTCIAQHLYSRFFCIRSSPIFTRCPAH